MMLFQKREHGTTTKKKARTPLTINLKTETETIHEQSIFERFRYYSELQKEFQAHRDLMAFVM